MNSNKRQKLLEELDYEKDLLRTLQVRKTHTDRDLNLTQNRVGKLKEKLGLNDTRTYKEWFEETFNREYPSRETND